MYGGIGQSPCMWAWTAAMLPPRLDGGPVCDDSPAESGMRKCCAI